MAASETRYRSVFEAANAGKSVTLSTGEVNVNRAFCEMLGNGPEEFGSKTWQELTPAEDIGFVTRSSGPPAARRKGQSAVRRYIHSYRQ